MQETIIYIELLNEGTRVFAPFSAIHLGDRYYILNITEPIMEFCDSIREHLFFVCCANFR